MVKKVKKDRLIYFYHVPRTGGFSCYRLFEKVNKLAPGNPVWMLNDGHTPFVKKNHETFTFLRDPIGHTVSIYAYIVSHRGHGEHEFARKKTFGQWMRERKGLPGSYVGFFAPSDKKLETAKKNIEHITLIGFTETFNNDMQKLLDLLNLPIKYDGARHNASHRKPTPTKDDLDFIRKVRGEDFELFNHAKKLMGR